MLSPSRVLKDILLAEILWERDLTLYLFAISIVSKTQPVRRENFYYALWLLSKSNSDVRLSPSLEIWSKS